MSPPAAVAEPRRWQVHATRLACFLVIAFSIASLLWNGVVRGLSDGTDLYHFYAAGQLWNEHRDPYDYASFRAQLEPLAGDRLGDNRSGYFYPPHATVLFAVLATLPFETARLLLLALNAGLLLVSLALLARMLAFYRPLGLVEITLIVALANTGFGRLNLRVGQTSVFAAVFLLAAFVLAKRHHQIGTGLALAAASIKPSFLPLFLGYALLRRSFRPVAVALGASAALAILSLVLSERPVLGTLQGWLAMLRQQSASDDVNSQSPLDPASAALLHLPPLVYRMLDSTEGWAVVVAWSLILGLVAVSTALLAQRNAACEVDLLDFAIVATLSLLCVYHRSYDLFLLFPGVLAIYLQARRGDGFQRQLAWTALLLGVILVLTVPGDLTMQLSARFPSLLEHWWWRIIAPFQTWTSLAVLAALLWLRRESARPWPELELGARQGSK
jgi:hypothetical protein